MEIQQPYAKDIFDAYSLFHTGILALHELEMQGMRVDLDYLDRENARITNKIAKLEEIIYESDFYAKWVKYAKGKTVNIYSPKQMGDYLYNALGIKVKKQTKSGDGSTDDETLSQLGIPELKTFLEIKKLKKLRDTYLNGFAQEQVDGFIHPFFNLHLVRTFRGSSDRPNFQNIPKREENAMKTCRRALYPRIGHQLLEVDFGQLEVRIAACYHLDPNMIKYIETGHDMHKDVCMQIFKIKEYDGDLHGKLRSATKNGFVFPEFYGDYYKSCAEYIATNWCSLPKTKWKSGQGIKLGEEHLSDHMLRVGLTSYDKFEAHLQAIETDFWKTRFKVYDKWKERWWQEYQKKGYFTSKTGFLYSGVMSRNDAINYPVQGAAFHVLLWCLQTAIKTFKKLGMDTKIVGQIHDALVLDVAPDELQEVVKIMKQIMEVDVRKHWPWIIVPLEIDAELCPVDGSWAEKQKFKIH